MNFKQYQEKSRVFAIYPNVGNDLTYPTIGLCGETGEVAEKIKKVIRDKKGVITSNDKTELSKELGDVLWYVSQLASELSLDLTDIAKNNISKLQSRLDRDKLKGNGDNR